MLVTIGLCAPLLCAAAPHPQEPPELLRLEAGRPLAVEGEIVEGDGPIHTELLDARSDELPAAGRIYRIEVEESGPWHVELRSYSFDAYLVLRDPGGEDLAEDDDGLLWTHARLALERVEAGRTYHLAVCATNGGRGSFEMALRPGAPPALSPRELALADLQDAERGARAIEERSGPASEALGDALERLGIAHLGSGSHEPARIALERSLAIREEVCGPGAVETADGLAKLSMVHYMRSEHAAARALLERALSIVEKARGPEHPETATILGYLAEVMRRQGDLRGARPLAERALAILEKTLGADHPEVARTLNSLAMLLKAQGDYAAARGMYERAIAVAEKSLGPEHPATAQTIENLAVLLKTLGEYEAARPLYERGLAITEMVNGPDHPQTATSLNNLGVLLSLLGEHDAARAHHERALAIRERIFGRDHLTTATSCNNLGELLRVQGEFDAARPLLESALEIREEALGPEHSLTATSLHNLATLLRGQGDPESARPLLQRSLAIRERVLGPEHPLTASSLTSLAALIGQRGDLEGARPLQERALAIQLETLGAAHPETALSLNTLAILSQLEGDLETARFLYGRALAAWRDGLGPEHRLTATASCNLAEVLMAQGDLEEARSCFERALASREDILGPAHPDTAAGLIGLATVLVDLDRTREAWEIAGRGRDDRRAHTIRTLGALTEGERYRYLAQLRRQLALRLSLAGGLPNRAERLEAYEDLLDWKGRVVRQLRTSRARFAAEMPPEQRERLEELQACQSRLSALALRTEVPDRRAHRSRLEDLLGERNRLELGLLRAIDASPGEARVAFENLRSCLPPDSAVLDFFNHPVRIPPSAEDQDAGAGSWSEARLWVWITRPELHEPVHLDLGPSAEIDAAIRSFLDALVAQRGIRLGEPVEARSVARLRGLLWDPIAPHVEGAATVFVSPDGALGTLPLETLQLADESFLLERHAFVYQQDLSSLARSQPVEERTSDSLLCVGAVDFSARPDPAGRVAATAPADPELRGGIQAYWARLPATGYESQAVHDLHQHAFGEEGRRLLLQGALPTEGRLKAELSGHAVLHLATHGFFQPEGLPSMWEEARNEAGRRELRLSAEASHLLGKHPGLLSGLVCAGAVLPPAESLDDGYLTAEEVGWLDLSGVELVVLSACETGLGRVQSGEGLIGLRRAFQAAGVETVISSLWSVRDESTSELMQAFYANLWLKGFGPLEALRRAQLDMLDRNRMRYGAGRPSTWGAFVLTGGW